MRTRTQGRSGAGAESHLSMRTHREALPRALPLPLRGEGPPPGSAPDAGAAVGLKVAGTAEHHAVGLDHVAAETNRDRMVQLEGRPATARLAESRGAARGSGPGLPVGGVVHDGVAARAAICPALPLVCSASTLARGVRGTPGLGARCGCPLHVRRHPCSFATSRATRSSSRPRSRCTRSAASMCAWARSSSCCS